MNKGQFLESERNRLERVLKFQLSNKFINIGIGLFVISFVSLLTLKGLANDIEWAKIIARNVLLISLLIISMSKDIEEDEFVKLLRAQSYVLAFVFGILYAIVQPIVNLLVESSLNYNIQSYTSLGDFQVLIFMLLIQLFSFKLLKRMR